MQTLRAARAPALNLVKIVALSTLLGAFAYGQVPAAMVSIINIDTSQGTPVLEYQVTGAKPVTAIVIRRKGPSAPAGVDHVAGGGFVVWQIYQAPLTTNQIGSLPVWNDVDAAHYHNQVEIAAVIFSDGTHVGTAPDIDGVDTVSKLFQRWRGEADATLAWKKVFDQFPQDDHGFVQAFFSKVASLNVPQVAYSDYLSGLLPVDAGMVATANRLRADLARGSHLSIGSNVVAVTASRRLCCTLPCNGSESLASRWGQRCTSVARMPLLS
jgi:hypothetical protein